MSELRPGYLQAVRDGLGLSGVTGDMKAGGGAWLGDEVQQVEAAGCLHLDGSIQKSEGIGCRVLGNANQTAAPAGWTLISFATAQKNDFSMWAIGSPADVVIQRPGFYVLSACVEFDTKAITGGVAARVALLVDAVPVSMEAETMTAGVALVMSISCVIWLDELQVVQLSVAHDEAAGVPVLYVPDYSQSLGVVRLA